MPRGQDGRRIPAVPAASSTVVLVGNVAIAIAAWLLSSSRVWPSGQGIVNHPLCVTQPNPGKAAPAQLFAAFTLSYRDFGPVAIS